MHRIAMAQRAGRADRAFDALHVAGWSIGEITGTLGHYVYGTRGEQVIGAHDPTAAEAWQQALEQAEAMPTAVVRGLTVAKLGRKPIDLAGQQLGKWTVLAFAGRRRSISLWRCRCDCGAIKTVLRTTLMDGFKRACDRCARLAKPAYRKVAQWRAQGVPQVEMARRLGTKEQWVSRMLDLIEDRQPSRRSKTHCPHGHRYTAANTEREKRHGWRQCRTCRRQRDRGRKGK